MFWICSRIFSSSAFTSTTTRAISRSLHLEPMVLVSRLISCMRKSSLRPMGSWARSMARSWSRWLRSRTVSSSTATLSAKMAASVRIRASSTVVESRTSRIFARSFSRYSATDWGERASTKATFSRMASALAERSRARASPSVRRMAS